jgi:hypothetical protein
MTQAQAQSVAGAVIAAGFAADVFKQPDGNWIVRGKSAQFDIGPASVSALANAQSVTAKVKEAEFS